MLTFRIHLLVFWLVFVGAASLTPLYAQNPDPDVALAGFPDQDAMRRALGLSLGAARVYEKPHGFAFSGYAETLYHTYSKTTRTEQPTGKDQEMSLMRGVLFLGYRFNERLILNSEVRVDRDLIERGYATFPEHYTTTKSSTEVSLDLAYVDYIMSPALTLRAGVVLVPMGLINEFHQPNEYLGTRSGYGDLYTIPSVWHALGFGVAGHKWAFDYRVYVVNGMNAAGFTEFGFRGGREISSDTISNPSLVFRLDYNPFPGGVLGGSYYIGNSGVFGLPEDVDLKVHTTLKEAHGELRWKGAFARAQYAKGLLQNTPSLNRILGTTGLRAVSSRVVGGYAEGGYNILSGHKSGIVLMPYVRGEASNPQDALPGDSKRLGLVKNHFLDFIKWIWGVEVRPISPLSIKTEYERIHDQNQIGWNEFHVDVSYAF